jgi:hypothetical protein
MGAAWAFQALCGEDIVGRLGGHLLCRDRSAFSSAYAHRPGLVWPLRRNAPSLDRSSNCRGGESSLHGELRDHGWLAGSNYRVRLEECDLVTTTGMFS